MNQAQTSRFNDKTSDALRALYRLIAAEIPDAKARFWCDGSQDRLTDLDGACHAVSNALASYVRYESDPEDEIRTDGFNSIPSTANATRKRAFLARVVPLLSAILRGEHVTIPESSDLGSYPDPKK